MNKKEIRACLNAILQISGKLDYFAAFNMKRVRSSEERPLSSDKARTDIETVLFCEAGSDLRVLVEKLQDEIFGEEKATAYSWKSSRDEVTDEKNSVLHSSEQEGKNDQNSDGREI